MNSYGIIFTIVTTFANEIADPNKTTVFVVSGYRPNPTIIEGRKASMEEFPYIARVYSVISSKAKTCTSTVVTKKLVLTAAHCLYGHREHMKIVMGEENHNDYVRGMNLGKYIEYKVSKVHAHPSYDPSTFQHDVALLELDKPVPHPGLKFLSMSFQYLEKTMPGKICGWGKTAPDKENNELYAKNVHAEMCTRRQYDEYRFICLEEFSALPGDSGGPIIIENKVWGVCSHNLETKTHDGTMKKTNYYVSLWQEREFLESVLNCGGLSYNRFFLYVTLFLLLILKYS